MKTVNEGFLKGEVVWAKITGFPWWPGAVHSNLIQIADIDANSHDPSISTYLIKFFGEDSQYIFSLQLPVAYYPFRKSQSILIPMLNSRRKQVVAKN